MTAPSLPHVFLPGFMLDATLWDDLIAQLPQGTTCLHPHLQQGENIHDIARNIVATLPPRFILIGFSMGGYVARSLAAQFPDRIAALVLIATSLRPDTPEQKQAKQNAARAMGAATFKGLPTKTIATSLHPARAEDNVLIKRIQDMGIRLGAQTFKTQSALAREDVPAAHGDYPTLVIAGDHDLLRSHAEAEELATAMQATLVTIAQSGHMIPLEQPAALANALQSWLKRALI